MSTHVHWVPSTKADLVRALRKRFPEDRSFSKKPTGQLYAIWFRLWSKAGCQGCLRQQTPASETSGVEGHLDTAGRSA